MKFILDILIYKDYIIDNIDNTNEILFIENDIYLYSIYVFNQIIVNMDTRMYTEISRYIYFMYNDLLDQEEKNKYNSSKKSNEENFIDILYNITPLYTNKCDGENIFERLLLP